MSCPDRESLSAFADGAVEAPLLAEIERHLSDCAHCREFVLEMRRLNTQGRASLQAIKAAAGAESAPSRRTALRARLMCELSLAAAAVLLLTVSAWFATRTRNASRLPTTPVSTKRPSEEKYVMPSDADFEAWAAPYRRLHIPLVPMEDVATYRPREINPIFPESAARRNPS
jgi:predicted anti-sigma-YlaC factor YlaD